MVLARFNPLSEKWEYIGSEADRAGSAVYADFAARCGDHIGGSILDNGDFKVNQRGMSVYSGFGFCADRWFIESADAVVSVLSSAVDVSGGSADSGVLLSQKITRSDVDLSGKKVTLSVYVTNVSESFGIRLVSGDIVLAKTSAAVDGGYSLTAEVPSDYSGELKVQFTGAACSFRLHRAKLELGEAATVFVPNDPADELARCRRYFRRIIGTFAPERCGEDSLEFYIGASGLRASPVVQIQSAALFNTLSGIHIVGDGGLSDGWEFSAEYDRGMECIRITAFKRGHGVDKSAALFIPAECAVWVDAESY